MQKHDSDELMSWYILLSGLYLLVLTLVLMFFAGAAKLNEEAEANSRAKLKLVARRFPPNAIDPSRYRDAA